MDNVLHKKLLEAVHKNDLPQLRSLLEVGADPTFSTEDLGSAIVECLNIVRNEHTVLTLLTSDVNLNYEDKFYGVSPIVCAVIRHHVFAVRLFSESEVDFNHEVNIAAIELAHNISRNAIATVNALNASQALKHCKPS